MVEHMTWSTPLRRPSGLRTTNRHPKISVSIDIITQVSRMGSAPGARDWIRSGSPSASSVLVVRVPSACSWHSRPRDTRLTLSEVDLDWIASAAARIGDADLLLETAGVVFAFNTINRIADVRRVRLEYSLLRELKPIRGWVERRLATLTGLAYDLSYKHQPRHSPANSWTGSVSFSSDWVHRLCRTSSTG